MMKEEANNKEKAKQTTKGKVSLDKRHSHFRISATKNDTGNPKSVDITCCINTCGGGFVNEAETKLRIDGTSVLKDNQSPILCISVKDILGNFNSVEMECCSDTENNTDSECKASPNDEAIKRPCWLKVVRDIFNTVENYDQLWNIIFTVLITGIVGVLQYYDVVFVDFCSLEDSAISISTSIAGLTFAALTLILPLSRLLQVGNVNYYKELAGTFSYTILINLMTVLCAVALSCLFSGFGYAWKNYLLLFLLVYSIILVCSATLHCFCIHTFMNQDR